MAGEQSDGSEVWIGLVEIRQRPGAGVLLDSNDALVNTLAIARDIDEHATSVRHAFDSLGFVVKGIEDPEPLSKYTENVSCSD